MKRLFITLALALLAAPILSGTVLLKGGLVHSGNDGVATVQDILISENIIIGCLLYTSPSPRDMRRSRMPSSA